MQRQHESPQATPTATEATATEPTTADSRTAFTSAGAIPAVAHAASAAGGPSASERAFGGAVQMKKHHHIPGGDRNVAIGDINDKHKGWDSGHVHHDQGSRVGIGKHRDTPKLATDASVYTNDGQPIGSLHAGASIPVNAGTICHLEIAGKKVACVLGHGHPPGWIPVSHFEHHAELAHVQSQLSHEINHARHTGHDAQHGHAAKTITNNPIPASIDKLFTKPNQQSTGANHAHDYYVRDGGRVNLLLNIPTWGEGGERLGVAADVVVAVDPGATVVPAESKFHPTGQHASSPLYHHGSDKQAGHITFVYGYVVNSAGEKKFGWINAHLLS